MVATELLQQAMVVPWTRQLEGEQSLVLVCSVAHYLAYRKPEKVAGQMSLVGAVYARWGSGKQLTVKHSGRPFVECNWFGSYYERKVGTELKILRVKCKTVLRYSRV